MCPSRGAPPGLDDLRLYFANAIILLMRKSTPKTPLLALLRELKTPERRTEFAELAGTKVDYLYQLAGCNRGACRSLLAKNIADASVVMAERYGTSAVTMEQLATMCQVVAAEAA